MPKITDSLKNRLDLENRIVETEVFDWSNPASVDWLVKKFNQYCPDHEIIDEGEGSDTFVFTIARTLKGKPQG